jgi:hypothetical protein
MPAALADEHVGIDYRDCYEELTGRFLRTWRICGDYSMREIEGLARPRPGIADTP